jgi:hypothetical protein
MTKQKSKGIYQSHPKKAKKEAEIRLVEEYNQGYKQGHKDGLALGGLWVALILGALWAWTTF